MPLSFRLGLVLLASPSLAGCTGERPAAAPPPQAPAPSPSLSPDTAPAHADLQQKAGCQNSRPNKDSRLPIESGSCTVNGASVLFATFRRTDDRERWINIQQILPLLSAAPSDLDQPTAGHYAVGTGWAIECDEMQICIALAGKLGGVSRDR